MRISLANSDRVFSVAPRESILDAALKAGIRLPYGCKGGNCGACRARLLAGDLDYPNGAPLGLSAAETKEGFVLLCQGRARSDLSLELAQISDAGDALVKRLPARIARAERVAHDVLQIYLRLPAAESFEFSPGQYIDVILDGGRRRSFSIASPPHDAHLLELHVRRVAGGEFTERLFGAEPQNSLLTIEGPFGRFVYRPESTGPLLLVGGGTGLAPLKSIIRHVHENALGRETLLYWGVRSAEDLYAHAELSALAVSAANFRYTAVISGTDPQWSGARGWVHEAVMRDRGNLGGCDIYASGPPSMIEAVQRHFPAHGAAADRLFTDSFDYALDTLARHRKAAATRS